MRLPRGGYTGLLGPWLVASPELTGRNARGGRCRLQQPVVESSSLKRWVIGLLLGSAFCVARAWAEDAPDPWRLDQFLHAPQGFSLSGQFRIRYETLDGQFRSGFNGGDQLLALRTNLLATLRINSVIIAAEGMDARAELADSGTPLSTSVVNPLDLLQAWIDVPVGHESRLRVGRLTMDVGSRRLVARNRFRNTINAFTGADWTWDRPSGDQLRAFFTFPVERRVCGSPIDNRPKMDVERGEVRFWGLYYARSSMPWGAQGEIYLLGLHEADSRELATRNRRLYTPGFRFYRNPQARRLDFQIESIFQFGTSRASTSTLEDLDHLAHFQHAEVGYSWEVPWQPRLLLQYDYASGDEDPTDGEDNRFDTLFGARRFDFGPTGIYGPFARSNLSTPGIRLFLKPTSRLAAMSCLRGFWLASTGDSWTTARISNPPGVHHGHIGTQIEARLQWAALPGNVRLELGGAHLFRGALMESAGKGDSDYFYLQTMFSF